MQHTTDPNAPTLDGYSEEPYCTAGDWMSYPSSVYYDISAAQRIHAKAQEVFDKFHELVQVKIRAHIPHQTMTSPLAEIDDHMEFDYNAEGWRLGSHVIVNRDSDYVHLSFYEKHGDGVLEFALDTRPNE